MDHTSDGAGKLDISQLQSVPDRPPGAALTTPAPLAPASQATMDSAIRARLAAIAGDDAEFIADLVNTFIASSTQILQEMRAAADRNDCVALGAAAHKLNGASANLQIDSIAALARDIELRARAGRQGDWRCDLEQLTAEFVRAEQNLRRVMDNPPLA